MDGTEKVTAFMGRGVMEDWVDPKPGDGRRGEFLYRSIQCAWQTHAVAIKRIVTSKYRRGAAFNPRHPFVDVLLSDITESGEVLDVSELLRAGSENALVTPTPTVGHASVHVGLWPIADMRRIFGDVRFGPEADIGVGFLAEEPGRTARSRRWSLRRLPSALGRATSPGSRSPRLAMVCRTLVVEAGGVCGA